MAVIRIDETHRPDLRSFVASANEAGSDFPIQNLPFGVFRRRGSTDAPGIGVAIGNEILDLAACAPLGLLDPAGPAAAAACLAPVLNPLMALGREAWRGLRLALSHLLAEDSPAVRKDPGLKERILLPMTEAALLLPARVGDYTDFYASLHHAANVGSMFRPHKPLPPNYKHLPIGYHGRASSLVPSGTLVLRPSGQTLPEGVSSPLFAPTRQMDYECEVGAFVGAGNALGHPIPIAEAGEHLFGLCLVNDWSARDVQRWEYQPLGPFLAKSFATSLSPWVVTLDALAPFRTARPPRAEGDPPLLPYLDAEEDRLYGAIDLTVEVHMSTRRMRESGVTPVRLSRGRFRELYWTLAQMLAHHASNGCNLRPGDLLATGTLSGPERENRGCLLELTWRGREPISLPTGESRTFLEDGDEVTLRGACEREGFARIGFGECTGTVVAGQTR